MSIMNYKSTVIMLLYIYILLIIICIYTKKEEYFENYEILIQNMLSIIDKSKDRYSSIQKQTKDMNIKNWNRFYGVDGRTS